MELKEIKELLKAFDESDSSYLKISQDGMEIKLKKSTTDFDVVPVVQSSSVKNISNMQTELTVSNISEEKPLDGELVLAPLVGVFYSAPSPEEKPYVQVGDKVKAGQVLCLIEAMKMMSEITAPRDGIIKEIYVKNQDVVGFEEQLFLIGD